MMDEGGSRQLVVEFLGLRKNGVLVEPSEYLMTVQSMSPKVLVNNTLLCLPHQEQDIPHIFTVSTLPTTKLGR